ncbi:MAG TPA: SIS domain-containing protein [Candidatus Limnocylindria bacterium]
MSLRSEIAEQPRVIRQLLESGWPEARMLARPLAVAEHLTIAARGSSDNAATYGKYLFESLAGVVTALAAPSLVTRYRTPPSFARGAVIGISQSGAAPDVAAVLAEARAARAPTIAITNRAGSLLSRTAQETFLLRAGAERSVAATKTYTATCVALALLAANTAEARGRSALSLAGLVESVTEAERTEDGADRLARRIGKARAIVVLGRGYEYATALEAALKIKELARVWAEPYSSADFAHGPVTLLESGVPVLLFGARGAAQSEARALARKLGAKGSRIYAVTNDEGLAELADDAVLLRAPLSEAVTPISFAVVAQLVARSLARRHGRDVERPRGLSKVTRTR